MASITVQNHLSVFLFWTVSFRGAGPWPVSFSANFPSRRTIAGTYWMLDTDWSRRCYISARMGNGIPQLCLWPKALVQLIAGSSPRLANLAGRAGGLPVTAPSRWLLYSLSPCGLCGSQAGLFGSQVMEIHSCKLRPKGRRVDG